MTAPTRDPWLEGLVLRLQFGDCHASWCTASSCDGVCTRTTTLTAVDGRPVNLTVVLPADADQPVITLAARDGQPYQLPADEARRAAGLTVGWLHPDSIPTRTARPLHLLTGGAR